MGGGGGVGTDIPKGAEAVFPRTLFLFLFFLPPSCAAVPAHVFSYQLPEKKGETLGERKSGGGGGGKHKHSTPAAPPREKVCGEKRGWGQGVGKVVRERQVQKP